MQSHILHLHSQRTSFKLLFMSEWINVKEANNNLGELSKQLTGKQLALSISRGINRTLMKGRTEARKAVKDEYNIPQKNLSGINLTKSIPNTLTGNIYASAKPIPMNAFAPKFETQSRSIRTSKRGEQKVKERKRKVSNPGKGVSVEVHKGSRLVIPFAFMIPGAKPHVFARGVYGTGGNYGFQKRTKRINNDGNDIPVTPMLSVTVHAAVINPKSISSISKVLVREYPKELEHELRARINGVVKANKF